MMIHQFWVQTEDYTQQYVVTNATDRLGHYASNCPTLTNDNREMGHTNLTIGTNRGTSGFSFSQVDKETMRIPKTWVLLDNQTTVDVFCNVDLLDNICPAENTLDIRSNSGTTSTSYQGDLPGYGTVWYHPEGIANILSLS